MKEPYFPDAPRKYTTTMQQVEVKMKSQEDVIPNFRGKLYGRAEQN